MGSDMAEVDLTAARLATASFEPVFVSSSSFEALSRDASLARFGAAPSALTTLSKAHRACLALHLSGSTFGEIAARLGRPVGWVLRTLRDPLVKRIIEEVLAVSDMEMAALLPLAHAAIRQQLVHGSGQQKLRAADIALRANRKYAEQGQAESTAEDVVQQILSFASKAMEMATQQPHRASIEVVDVPVAPLPPLDALDTQKEKEHEAPD